MPRVDGCTYAMGLRGVREEEAKNLANGVSRDPEREQESRERTFKGWGTFFSINY